MSLVDFEPRQVAPAGWEPTAGTEIAQFPAVRGPENPGWNPEDQLADFEETWLHDIHESRVVNGSNDLIIGIAGASISPGSGIGKTTKGIRLCRRLDCSGEGWNHEKATLDSHEFARGLMNDASRLPSKSSVLFDEGTGTLDSDGADARRSMAGSVMDVTKALATLRYRQITAVIILQDMAWVDQRLRDVLDVLILIQEPGRAVIFHPYKNDLKPSTKYNDRKGELVWNPLPDDDEDYARLHEMKAKTTKEEIEKKADLNDLLDRDDKIRVGRIFRERGVGVKDVAAALDMSTGWVSENCSAGEMAV